MRPIDRTVWYVESHLNRAVSLDDTARIAINAVMRAIFSDWSPASGRQAAAAPLFELYGPEFDPRTGAGGFDVYVPSKV